MATSWYAARWPWTYGVWLRVMWLVEGLQFLSCVITPAGKAATFRAAKLLSVSSDALGNGRAAMQPRASIQRAQRTRMPAGLGGSAVTLHPPTLLRGPHVQALEELNVADNGITELPSGLARLARLRQLTVYGNELSALAQELIRMPSLQGAPARYRYR